MLAKKHRLTKEKDFKRVFEEGKSFVDQFIVLKIAKNNLDISRFGFIISLKIAKKSTTRHKIRRRLSEIIRLKLEKIEPGFDIIILAKPEIINQSYSQIDMVLTKALKKAKLLT